MEDAVANTFEYVDITTASAAVVWQKWEERREEPTRAVVERDLDWLEYGSPVILSMQKSSLSDLVATSDGGDC